MTGEISFVELGVDDVGRGREFYGALFGWSFRPGPSGEDAGAMVEIPGTPAGMHGGDAGAWPYVFFCVDDLDSAIQRVEELGGSVDPPMDEGGNDDNEAGRFRMCTDDQGSRFGLHEPRPGS